jgi:hypothetical protein
MPLLVKAAEAVASSVDAEAYAGGQGEAQVQDQVQGQAEPHGWDTEEFFETQNIERILEICTEVGRAKLLASLKDSPR